MSSEANTTLVVGVHTKVATMRAQLCIQDIGLWHISDNNALMHELRFFMVQTEGASISAGNCFSFSPGFQLSFYGMTATYLAVLVQSL